MSNKEKGEQKIIWPTVNLSEPNESIPVYTGEVELRGENETYIVDAIVEFKWYPRPRPIIRGTIELSSPTMEINEHKLPAFVNGLPFGECYILDTHFSSMHPMKMIIGGFLHGDVADGDITISVEQIEFSIPNLRYIRGANVKYNLINSSSGSVNGRSVFTTGDYEIVIDAIPNCSEQMRKLAGAGGYAISYGGKIKKIKGSITYVESKKVLEAFGVFLSFINGSQVNTMFHRGVYNGKTSWQGYKDSHVKTFNNVQSWLPELHPEGLKDMWTNFYTIWKKSEDDCEALRMSINWYLESLRGSGYIEGGIMMAQTSLELLYNWALIDTRRLIIGSDAANLSAANKIRLLLSQMNVPTTVPTDFQTTVTFVSANNEIEDAPDVIVQIRNAIVHAQLEKRKKLIAIPTQVKYETLVTSLWYVELSILYMLGYKGYYANRSAPMSTTFEVIPWYQP